MLVLDVGDVAWVEGIERQRREDATVVGERVDGFEGTAVAVVAATQATQSCEADGVEHEVERSALLVEAGGDRPIGTASGGRGLRLLEVEVNDRPEIAPAIGVHLAGRWPVARRVARCCARRRASSLDSLRR